MTTIQPQPSSPVTDALWRRYRADRDPEARAQLLDQYLGLVHHVAREIGARVTAVATEDLVGAGTLGLLRAVESFDPGRGFAFSTYAVQRIRGAILDDLRSRDWQPRSQRARLRQMHAARSALEQRLGRAPEAEEMAAELGIPIERYWQWAHLAGGTDIVSLDGTGPEAGPPLEAILGDEQATDAADALEADEQKALLREAIASLPDRERTVLALYYYEELNLKQIAEVLHVTESRISQIRTQAIRRLRERLAQEGD
jgi:RNA polymerase sigma factor for flagellar operon FliA